MESINVRNLTKKYGEKAAVDNVSFSVKKGSLFGFLGVNGAGKSTVINMLSTLIEPTAGNAGIGGQILGKQNSEIRSKIGIVYQQNCLDDLLTVKENLIFRGVVHGLSRAQANVKLAQLLDAVKLEEIIDKKYKVLSGGQKRKCEIAAALMNAPEILFLDEPTTGLDPATRKDVWSIVQKMQKDTGMTVFLTTHYMEEAANAEEVVIIDDGKIVTSGTPHVLKEKYAKDKLKLYYIPESKKYVETKLQKLGFAIKESNECIEIFLKSTLESVAIIEALKEYIHGFEVIQGTMDDVFLNAVGKEVGSEYEK